MVYLSLISVGFGHSLTGGQLTGSVNSEKKKEYLSHHLMNKSGSSRYLG